MQLFVKTKKVNIIVIAVLFLCSIILPLWLPSFLLTILNLILIYAILAISLDILMGYTGMETLGQAAFFGIAAYIFGILTVKYNFGMGIAILLGLFFSTIMAALGGLLAVRLKGLYFLVITLAFSQVFWGISHRMGEITGGWMGLTGVSRMFSVLESNVNFYYLVLAIFLIILFLMYRLVLSPFGLTLKGIKNSELRMRTTGYNVWLHKYIIFIICGFVAGISGVLNCLFTRFVSPDVLSVRISFEIMLMVIIGGTGTLIGPIIGAAIIIILRNFLGLYVDHWLIILGLVYIFATLYAPKGIIGLIKNRKKMASTQVEIGKEIEDKKYKYSFSAENTQSNANKKEIQINKRSNEIEVMRLENISKSFGKLNAVNNVSLKLFEGTRMAILGPNGAGKTTLFNLINGIYYSSSGRILFLNKDITRLSPHGRARMGLGRTFQITNLYPELTVIDNIRLGILGIHKNKYLLHTQVNKLKDVNDTARELLEFINLWDNKDIEVRYLSYGHQRQLEVALALASKPIVLLLDEPTAGLSKTEIKPMVELIKSLDPKMVLLIIEHDMDVAFALADEITVLHNGEVLVRGSKEEIKTNENVRNIYLGEEILKNESSNIRY